MSERTAHRSLTLAATPQPSRSELRGIGPKANEPPAAHRAAHRRETEKIRPLDAQGNPSAAAKIGLITIGFSIPRSLDPARGEVKAPLVLWGPYLWAQGNTPRKSDGLTWTQNDVREDQLHPSAAGCRKTTALLLNFFKKDEGASRWFLKSGATAQVAPLPK